MRVTTLGIVLLAAAACGPGGDPHASDAGVQVFACGDPPMLASLSLRTLDEPNFTLAPLRRGEQRDVTLTVTNTGQTDASELENLTAPSAAMAVSGGTCGAVVAAGSSCTVTLRASGTAEGRHTTPALLHFYNGAVYADAVYDLAFDVVAAPFAPAAAPPIPVMPERSAGLIQRVNLVTVTFSDSTNDDEVSALGERLVSSDWYRAVSRDYGLSTGTHQHVRLPNTSPDLAYGGADVVQLVNRGLLPAHGDGQDLYMFFFTPRTGYLVDYWNAAGWHATVMNGTVRVPYADIKPSCSGPATTSFVAAHELIEATTDSGTGYNFGFAESEVGDLCDGVFVAGDDRLPTSWSNAEAAAGRDPCVPSLGKPYFNVGVSPSGPQSIAAGDEELRAHRLVPGAGRRLARRRRDDHGGREQQQVLHRHLPQRPHQPRPPADDDGDGLEGHSVGHERVHPPRVVRSLEPRSGAAAADPCLGAVIRRC